MLPSIVSINGRLAPAAEASVSVFNVEYSYGFGVYETVRVRKGVPYFLEEHLQRLVQSARIIDLRHPFSLAQIAAWVMSLLQHCPADAYNLKLLLIGATHEQDAQLYILPLNPIFPDAKLYRDGVTVTTTRFERLLPQAKTLNMLQSYLAYRTAREAGAYDALLIDHAGMAREGTRTNLYMVQDGCIVTAPDAYVLGGVMRQVVYRVAEREGIPVQERLFDLKTLLSASGAFLSSTSSKAMPVRSIDGVAYAGIHPVVERIRDGVAEYLDHCNGTLS